MPEILFSAHCSEGYDSSDLTLHLREALVHVRHEAVGVARSAEAARS
jgi:pyridoxine 5'-phosphate synthase PdxJ